MNFMTKRNKGWLVIHLYEGEWHWCCQRPGLPIEQGSALNTIPVESGTETTLLLPGERIPLISVTQPGLTPDAARWALEPLLLEDIETQHIVTMQRESDQYILAAVERSWLKDVLQTLADAGQVPQRVLPDTLLLAPGTRLKIGDHWLLRLSDGSGLQLPDSMMGHVSTLSELDVVTDGSLLVLAKRARSENSNLLQGAFRVKQAQRRPLLCLGTAAALAVICLIGTPVWQGLQAQRALTQLNQQMLNRYQQYFPQEKPSNPRRAFSRKAAQTESASEDLTFITLLRQSEAALARMKENPLQTLSWDKKTSRLTLHFRDPVMANVTRSFPNTIRVEVREKQLIMDKKP